MLYTYVSITYSYFQGILYSFYFKNTIKIWLSAKIQYLSALSRKQTHQFTTYLLPTNEPWYASFPRYAKIWYSTSVLKQEKIEYFIDYGTPNMTFLFYFQPFLLDDYFITSKERSIRFNIKTNFCWIIKKEWLFIFLVI